MPDQPDDARKRPQRGVFPPFFAPRNGRGESPPTPPSGSWRRVSRLFTPPEVARQRRTPAAPQAPYTPSRTPPATPSTTPVLTPVAAAPEAPPVVPPPAASEDTAAESFAPEATAEDVRAEAPQIEPPPSLQVEEAVSDELARFDPMAFDEEVDRFVVESLETEPISLAPSELERLDVEVDSLDSVASGGTGLDDGATAEGAPNEALESIESYLADDVGGYLSDHVEEHLAASSESYLADDVQDDPSHYAGGYLSGDAAAVAGFDATEAGLDSTELTEVEAVDEVVSAGSDEAPVAEIEAQPTEPDPWAGAELPEPAFGSIGWPSSEIAALAAEAPVNGVDEMSAALAWSDGEETGTTADDVSYTASAGGTDVSSEEDALSAMAHELRDSSSAWVVEGDAQERDEADLSARARFYGGGETNTPAAELEVSGEASDYAAELAAAEAAGRAAARSGGDSGAAIADALARVAARIRAGEVELPSEAVGASDESALAAALAALLRGPRR